jgi:tetratricopeptide (TPR) repeat protein
MSGPLNIVRSILVTAVLFFPVLSFADADSVYRKTMGSIAVVTAYNRAGEPLTEGSGFVASDDGAIVTNYHVVGIAKAIKVRMGSRVLDVQGVIYGDRDNDLVVLKTKGKGMPAVRFGDSDKIREGEKVYIVSGTEGPGVKIHEGVFKGTKTVIHGRKALEITVPVSYGSSGSAVFNSAGEVIGIVTLFINRGTPLVWAMPVNLIRDRINSRAKTVSVDRIIKEYSSTAEYWFYLGYFLMKAGAPKDAIGVLREAVRLRPGYADAHYYLGVASDKLNRGKEAEGSFRKALKAAPDFADAHFSLGVLYGKQGLYKEAVEALKQAVKYAPDFPDAYYAMGVALGKSGLHRESIEAYKHAIRLKPDFPDAYYNLGLACEKTSSYAEAAEVFKKLLKYRPDYAEAHYNLGMVYLVLKDKDAALERYKILKGISPGLAGKLLNLIYN